MKKEKVAVSVDKALLDLIDSKVDNKTLRSRSHAFEYYLKQGLGNEQMNTVIILISAAHQDVCMKKINGMPLLKNQIDFFRSFGVSNIIIITQPSSNEGKFRREVSGISKEIKIIFQISKGNAESLAMSKGAIPSTNIIVISGDTFNDFDLQKMMKKHIQNDKLATIGLMTREKPAEYGSVILDGDNIVSFQEKSKTVKSHIVNAGIYIFKPEIFEMLENSASLEKDVFPRLARLKQLTGFFTYGEYYHMQK